MSTKKKYFQAYLEPDSLDVIKKLFKENQSAVPKNWLILILNLYQSLLLSFKPLGFIHLPAKSFQSFKIY